MPNFQNFTKSLPLIAEQLSRYLMQLGLAQQQNKLWLDRSLAENADYERMQKAIFDASLPGKAGLALMDPALFKDRIMPGVEMADTVGQIAPDFAQKAKINVPPALLESLTKAAAAATAAAKARQTQSAIPDDHAAVLSRTVGMGPVQDVIDAIEKDKEAHLKREADMKLAEMTAATAAAERGTREKIAGISADTKTARAKVGDSASKSGKKAPAFPPKGTQVRLDMGNGSYILGISNGDGTAIGEDNKRYHIKAMESIAAAAK